MDKPDYTEQDCYKIIDFYTEKKRNRVSYGLIRSHTDDEMLSDLKYAFGKYQFLKSISRAPTKEQLRKQHLSVEKSSKNLYRKLSDLTEYHFMASMVAARANTNDPIFFDDKKFRKVYDEIESLGEMLHSFIGNLDLCLKDNFEYKYIKPSKVREEPETTFIKDLSGALTKHFGKGGYTPNSAYRNKPTGWRIDCLEYLLAQVGIDKTRRQIVDIIAESKRKR